MKILFVQPHFDDIAFSIGGSIQRIIGKKTILTVFNKSNYLLNENIKSENPYNTRLQEDKSFCKHVNANYIHLNFLDSKLRSKLKINIDVKINLCWYDFVFLPLSIEEHIDHVICFETFKNILPDDKLIFYEDLPYADNVQFKTNDFLKNNNFNHAFINIDIFDKIRLVMLYKSQIDISLINSLYFYLHKNNLFCERLWFKNDKVFNLFM